MAVKPVKRLLKPTGPLSKRAVHPPSVVAAAATQSTTTTVTHTCLGLGSQEDLVDRHFRLSLMLTRCRQPQQQQQQQQQHLLMRQLLSMAVGAVSVTADELTDLHFRLSLGRQWPLTSDATTLPPARQPPSRQLGEPAAMFKCCPPERRNFLVKVGKLGGKRAKRLIK